MNVFDLIATLTLDTSEYENALSSAKKKALNSSDIGNNIQRGVEIGAKALTATGGAIVTAAGIGIKAYADYESAFTGVTKTINFDAKTSSEEITKYFEDLSDKLWDLSDKYPLTIEGIAGIAEVAGQLGIENSEIADFTEVVIALGESTNLSYEEAAIGLARYGNVAKMNQDEFDELAASIVELGNNTATSEKDIVYYMKNLANLANTAGLSNDEVAGFAATLSSVGAPAESSRTAMQNLSFTISRAVATGGEKLEVLAKTSGMTADEFKQAWSEDAAGALMAFYKGLDELGNGTAEQLQVFDDLGIKQTRQIDIHQRLAAANVKLSENVEMSKNAYKGMGEEVENYNALQTEAEKRNETLESKWQTLKNTAKHLAVEIGEALAPSVEKLIPKIKEVIDNVTDYIDKHPEVVKDVTAIGVGLLATGSTISTVLKVIKTVSELAVAFKSVKAVISLITGGGAGGGGIIGGLLTGIGAIAPALLAVGAVAGIFAINWKKDWGGVRTTYEETLDATGSKTEAFKAGCEQFTTVIGKMIYNQGKQISDWWNNSAVPWFDNIGNQISEWYTNLHTSVSEWLTNLWTSVKEWFTTAAENVGNWLTNLWTNITERFTSAISKISEWLTDIWNKVTGKLTDIWNTVVKKLAEIRNAVSEKLKEIWNSTQEKLEQIKETISNKITSMWQTAKNKLQSVVQAFRDSFEEVKSAISEKLQEGLSKVETVVETMKEKVRGVLSAVSEAWESVKNFASNPLGSIRSTVGNLFGGGYASGGWMEAGTTYLVGEEGPELITPSKNGYVHNARETVDMLRGNGDIIINIDGSGLTVEEISEKLGSAVKRQLRGAGAYL